MLKTIIGVLCFVSLANGVFADDLETNCVPAGGLPDMSEFMVNLKRVSPDLRSVEFRVRVEADSEVADAVDTVLGVSLTAWRDISGDLKLRIVTEQGSVSGHIKNADSLQGFRYDGGGLQFAVSETEDGYKINGELSRPGRQKEYIDAILNIDPGDESYSISEPGLELHSGNSVVYGSADIERYSKEAIGSLIGVIIRAQLIDMRKRSRIGVPVPVPPVPLPVPHPPVPAPQPKPCAACPEPFSRTDKVPPSKPHYPCPGTHTHYYVYHQGPPPECICRKQEDRVECD